MNAIDVFPPDTLPLRQRMPALTEPTREKLIEWGLLQPGALPWLLKRTALQWEKIPGHTDPHHRAIDAAAALDLLKFRLETDSDRQAVGHLLTPMDKPPNTQGHV